MKYSEMTKKLPIYLMLSSAVLISNQARADFVIADDLIVNNNSACVGFDCVNGESFGSDTIRLKENNLRIHFDDTSTSASFPRNDWRLVANEQANGGASKFSIVDATSGRTVFTILAAAPANSVFVDSAGRLGLGTSTPVTEIHTADGDTPTLRLEQNGSSGFAPQTWDIAGNETNFFVRDASNGSTLPFRIFPGSASSSLTIRDNNVGVGTASPAYPLHVLKSDGSAKLVVEDTNSTTTQRTLAELINNGLVFLHYTDTDQSSTWRTGLTTNNQFLIKQTGTPSSANVIVSNDGTNSQLGIGTSPSHPIDHSSGAHLTLGGVWTNASSRSKKSDIKELGAEQALQAIRALQPVRYKYKIDNSEEYVGFIAEDVPDIVAMKDRNSLSSMDIVAVLTKVVKEQDKVIQEMKSRLIRLESSK
jgi:hypothetical protein